MPDLIGLEGADETAFPGITDLFDEGETKGLQWKYRNEQEDATPFRGDPKNMSMHAQENQGIADPTKYKTQFSQVVTRYLDEAERQESEVHVNQDGKLVDGSGALIDTRGAKGTGTVMGSGEGKYVFAEDVDGVVRATDAWGGHRQTAPKGLGAQFVDGGTVESEYFDQSGASEGSQTLSVLPQKRLEMVNHSSLVGGGRVRGAGELTIDQGKLAQVSDASGHYHPGGKMLHHTLDKFQTDGVDLHDVAVKMVGKSKDQAPAFASARELMQYEGAPDAEEQIRAQRDQMKSEIAGAAQAREERLKGGHMILEGEEVATTVQRMDPRARQAVDGRKRGGRIQDLIGMFEGMY